MLTRLLPYSETHPITSNSNSQLNAKCNSPAQSSSHAARTLDDRFITHDRYKVHHKIQSFAKKFHTRI
jgi:hypothetical protein